MGNIKNVKIMNTQFQKKAGRRWTWRSPDGNTKNELDYIMTDKPSMVTEVAFEDIPVFGVCRPGCHDSSLYLFVLVLFIEAVVLSQVHVAWDIFYQHIVYIYRGVVYNHHLCLCDVHLKTHSSTFIG